MKEILGKWFGKIKKQVKELKNNIKKTTATKLFWCETLIIVAFLIFIITNFLLNFFVGMYALSLFLFLIALFAWKYL